MKYEDGNMCLIENAATESSCGLFCVVYWFSISSGMDLFEERYEGMCE
jgi:hypothetical protein